MWKLLSAMPSKSHFLAYPVPVADKSDLLRYDAPILLVPSLVTSPVPLASKNAAGLASTWDNARYHVLHHATVCHATSDAQESSSAGISVLASAEKSAQRICVSCAVKTNGGNVVLMFSSGSCIAKLILTTVQSLFSVVVTSLQARRWTAR